MEKKCIGYKAKNAPLIAVCTIIGGIAVIVAAVLSWVFLIRGAIGGGITGGLIALGGMLVGMGVMVIIAPKELVHIDDRSVYLGRKNIVAFGQIVSVQKKGSGLLVMSSDGKKIPQGFIQNSDECVQHINEAVAIYRQSVQSSYSQNT